MKGILQVIPRPIRVRLGGQDFLVSEYTLADVADLQAWAESRVPDDFESAVPELYYGPQGKPWKRLIARLLDSIEKDPFDDQIDTDEGTVRQVYQALRRHQPALTVGDVADMIRHGQDVLPGLTSLSVRHILRSAWGNSPKDLLRYLIDGPSEGDGGTDWSKLFYQYITSVTGPAPKFEDMTLGQVQAWCRGGKDGEDNRQDYAEVAKKRAEFFEEIEDDGDQQ